MDQKKIVYIVLTLAAGLSIALCRPNVKTRITHQDLIREKLKHGKLDVSYIRFMKFFSPKGKGYLQVKTSSVDAQGAIDSEYVDMLVESVDYDKVRIKGSKSQSYICFNSHSVLIVQQNGEDINCIFTEAFSEKTGRTIFTSLIHKAWHIAIKNNGIVRAGERINKTGSHNYTNEFTPLTIKKKDDDEE